MHSSRMQQSVADLRGAPGTRAPPGGQNSFIFMQFSTKKIGSRAYFGNWHPPRGKSWIRHWQWSAAVVICEGGCLPGGGVYLGGCLPRWDVCRGGVCLVGVYLCVGGWGRGSAHVGVHPPVDRILDTHL